MSFFNDFFGKTQQRDLTSGFNQSNATINEYGDKSRDAYAAGANEAKGYYQPWAESGRRGQTAYEDSLGLNGAQGGQNALMMYQAGRNPYLDYEQDMAQRGLDRAANARGMSRAGSTQLAAARARQGLGYQDYQGWQNRLMGVGQQGYAADQARAGIAQNAGQYAADSYAGQGQQLAGNAINYSNALAQSRNTGINNLLGVAGLGLKATGWGGFGASPRGVT